MKKKIKLYLRLNLVSIVFIAISFISVTLAWFAYSGLTDVATEVNVKAWYVELEKDGEVVSNDIVISIDDIYPGMEPIEEEIKIKNLGDSDAQVKYEIASARILGDEKDNYLLNGTVNSKYIEDKISHDYPFNINIDLKKHFILAGTDETTFKVSISWPLDSDNDEFDSLWGTKAYNFKQDEKNKKTIDDSYQIRSSIKIDIKLTAEQYVETPEASDTKFKLGNEIKFDVVQNRLCTKESSTCLTTNVIDVNNTLSDKKVTLLPKVSKTYLMGTFNDINNLYNSQTASWTIESRLLEAKDILKVVSKDITNSYLVRPNISDSVIGNLEFENRLNDILLKAINSQGYFKFLNKFLYFSSSECYWLNNTYGDNKAFAISTLDENNIKLNGEDKNLNCKVIPVIIADKVDLY